MNTNQQGAFDSFSLQTKSSTVGINPTGGYVTSWKVKNPKTNSFEDILYQGKTIKRTGIPILFPQFSEANGMRKHGFGRDCTWKTSQINPQTIQMILTNKDLPGDAKKEYPYPFYAVIEIEIRDSAELHYTLKVTNTGTANLPISPGLHPYWAVPHQDKKLMSIDGIPEFDTKKVEWDAIPPDIGYPYTGKTVINLSGKKISIEDVTPSGPVIHHIVVWSQTPKQDDFNYVCVEPVTGYIHALDTHPIIVKPKETWQMKITFSVVYS
jgi:galactose mutarotase-like enzyme